ncbi:hypothetical protein ACOMHN_015867 [Nucella lapillus]
MFGARPVLVFLTPLTKCPGESLGTSFIQSGSLWLSRIAHKAYANLLATDAKSRGLDFTSQPRSTIFFAVLPNHAFGNAAELEETFLCAVLASFSLSPAPEPKQRIKPESGNKSPDGRRGELWLPVCLGAAWRGSAGGVRQLIVGGDPKGQRRPHQAFGTLVPLSL